MNTLSFEEWKEKRRGRVDAIVKDIMTQYGGSKESPLFEYVEDYYLAESYKLYRYQVKNPNWFETLKDENSETLKVRDDWESIVDREMAAEAEERG